jgi:hypothetical protein
MVRPFYRFRSVDALLGERAELDSQEIYFASPAELNDPMEGFKDLYWQGDEIVWRNLIRHYALCLLNTVMTIVFLWADFTGEKVPAVFGFDSMAESKPEDAKGEA